MPSPVTKETGEMSMEELDAVLALAQDSDVENPDNSEVDEPEVTPETTPKPEVVEPVLESPKADEPAAPAKPAVTLESLQSQLADLATANEKLRLDNANQKRLNGHLSNELGVAKRKPPTPTPLPTDTDMLEKPVEATQQVVKATLDAAQAESDKRRQATEQSMQATFQQVHEVMPDFGNHIEAMAEVLAEGGMPADGIRAFKHNPMAVINDAAHLIQLAQRTIYAKQNADLVTQLEEAKKGPAVMAKNLAEAAGATPAINSTTVRAPRQKPAGAPNFQKMSDEQLKKWMADNPPPPPPEDEE